MSGSTVNVGDTFRSVIADCNALWRVDRVSAGVAHCHVVNEPWEHEGVTYPGEYAGRTDVFKVSDVAHKLAAEKAMRERRAKADEFFAGLEIGSDVHYDHGFGQWVRCEVVAYNPDVHHVNGLNRDMDTGRIVLRPYALVGPAWKPRDLPGWFVRADGEWIARYCYHAGVIERGEVWRPDYACVYESGKVEPRKGDPTTMEPHSLNPDDNIVHEEVAA